MGCGASTNETSAPINASKPPGEQKKQQVQPPKDSGIKQTTPRKQQLRTSSKGISPSKSNQETPRNPQKSPTKKVVTQQTTTANNNMASSTKTINSPSKVKLDIHPVDQKPQLKKTATKQGEDKKKIKKKKAAEDKKLSQLIRVYEL